MAAADAVIATILMARAPVKTVTAMTMILPMRAANAVMTIPTKTMTTMPADAADTTDTVTTITTIMETAADAAVRKKKHLMTTATTRNWPGTPRRKKT